MRDPSRAGSNDEKIRRELRMLDWSEEAIARIMSLLEGFDRSETHGCYNWATVRMVRDLSSIFEGFAVELGEAPDGEL